MTDPRPFTDDDLHAYADGALDAARRDALEAWLAENPDDRAAAAAWQAQNEGLHALYDGVLDEPVPAALSAAVQAPPRRFGPPPWTQVAAGIALLAVGFAGGWGARDLRIPSVEPDGGLVRHAVTAHIVFTREKRHAVEAWADKDERHLVRWLSARLGQRFDPPALGDLGFRLVGGRLIADAAGPAAQFMYEDAKGRRLTLYVRRTETERKSGFREASGGGVEAFYWTGRPLSYAVIGGIGRDELTKLARSVYGSLGY